MNVRRRASILLLATFGVAAVVIAIVVSRQYAADMRAANARLLSSSKVVQTACGRIEYAVAGRGPAVLLVHGAGGGFDQGLDFGSPLVRAGFTVVAPSRFGYLGTPLPADASPRAQADAHVCLLNALGIDKVAAVGGSAGAPSVIQLCLRHPERCSAMILAVPAVFIPEPGRPPIKPSRLAELLIQTTLRSDFVFWAASRMARDSMIESILATPAHDVAQAPPDEQLRVLAILRDIQPVSRRAQGLWTDATVTTAPAQVDFERIDTPTLIIATENDRFGTLVGARIAARRIPGARLVTYPDGGHVWVGHQSEVWSEVVKFLRDTSGAAAAPDEAALTRP
ncbi:MAG: alpha/beta hydrolase [Gammaproteobacteria bacterium]